MVLFARSATPSSKRTPSWGIWLESALLEDVSKRPAAIEVELNPILDTVHAAGAQHVLTEYRCQQSQSCLYIALDTSSQMPIGRAF
jgi:hypothetical protein